VVREWFGVRVEWVGNFSRLHNELVLFNYVQSFILLEKCVCQLQTVFIYLAWLLGLYPPSPRIIPWPTDFGSRL